MSFRSAIAPLVLAMVLGIALAWPLRSPPIDHHGEAREGLVVQGIVDRGEWVLPRRNGELPSKPPLFHWLAAAASLVLGLSDATLRLPSAVAAWAVWCLTFALGTAIGTRTTGWLAVGALLGMVPFVESAIEARVDMLFTAAVTGTLAAFFFWYRDRSPRARTLVYLAASAAVLAKGPVGAALPALVIVVFLAVAGDLGRLRNLWSWRLLALAALIDGGWYALATMSGGREFIELQLFRENWSRFVGSDDFQRQGRGNTFRLPIVLATQFLPWTLVLAWSAIRRLRGIRADAAERFLHVWWMVVLGVFSVGAGKRPVYLLPAAPAIAILAARVLAAAVAKPAVDIDATSARTPFRVPLSRLALAILVFDVGALAVQQIVREVEGQRRSLVAFSDAVARIVPANDPVTIVPPIPPTDRMVLAYRLRRPILERESPPEAGALYLVPAPARLERWCGGATLLAESGDTADDFALMRAKTGPQVGLRRPGSVCALRSPSDRPPAGTGGPGPDSQKVAGTDLRVVIPLGDATPVKVAPPLLPAPH